MLTCLLHQLTNHSITIYWQDYNIITKKIANRFARCNKPKSSITFCYFYA